MATKTTARKRATTKRPAAKKTAAKKATAKKTASKKTAAKKTTAEKTTAKKATTKQTYTKPELRERLKRRIMQGTKGGKAGQWSARKAQLLAHEYEAQGGGYSGKRGAGQRHLAKWTDEQWTTADGKRARRAGGTTRYLPKKAWSKLSAAEKKATNRKKVEGSRRGRQVVSNTRRAAAAGKSARKSGRTSAPKSARR